MGESDSNPVQVDSGAGGPARRPAVMDLGQFMADYGDLGEQMGSIIESFLLHSAPGLERVQKAIVERDGTALKSAAHALKGSVAQMFAHHCASLCARLELMGKERAWDGVDALGAEVAAELARLATALRGLASEKNPAA